MDKDKIKSKLQLDAVKLIAKLIGQGLTYNEIADMACISTNTLANIRDMSDKVAINTLAGFIYMATQFND
jgi:uncharacterized protein YerC